MIPVGPAPKPPPQLPSRASLYVPANLLVLAWFVAAAVVTVVHRFVPAAGWLMVHLLLLGGVGTAILLWSQHFAETLLRSPAPGGRRGLWARLLGWSGGAALTTAGMVTATTPLTVAGAVVCGGVALAHVAILIRQGRGSTRALGNRYAHLVRYYLLAGALVPAGVAIGVLLARTTPSPEAYGRLYLAHVLLLVLGWIGLTVAGTVVLLWPTVLHVRLDPPADAAGRRSLWVLAGGLAVMLAGCGWRPLVAVGATVFVGGIALLGRHLWRQGRLAATRTGDSGTGGGFAAWSVAASLIWFAVSVAGLGTAVVAAPSWAAVPPALTSLIAPFAAGFVAQVMVGSMTYLVPVVLGGRPAAVRRHIRGMNRAGAARLVILNACTALFSLPALGLTLPSWVAVSVSLLGLAALLAFLALTIRVVATRNRPGIEAAAVAAPGPVRVLTGAAAGTAAVVLAVIAGVAVDPVSAGVTALPGGGGVVAAPGGAAATGETTRVTVRMVDMRFEPDVISVPAGNRLEIEVVNEGDQVHDLILATGASSGRLDVGESAVIDAGVITGAVEGWCSVAGHRLMGMTLTVLADGVAAGPAPTPTDHGDHQAGAGGLDPAAVAKALNAPAPEGYQARDAALPPAPAGTTHEYTFTVREAETEVAPGITQTLWTFNGTAPGPTLRGKVGDTFVITLVNDGTIGHSIDFHAGALAPDQPMRTIGPGESLTYTFTATRSGIWMYHCGTAPMSLHVANGMFGAVVIDPPDLAKVDHEFLLVQSEYYLGAEGTADPARAATQNPDLVTFNGHPFQYKYAPLRVNAGETVRFWVLDVGPNRPSSFHIVGGQFDTVFFEGEYLLRDGGSTGTGGSQALALQPAQGGFVELTFPEAGHYTFVSHIFGDLEKGAAGIVEVK